MQRNDNVSATLRLLTLSLGKCEAAVKSTQSHEAYYKIVKESIAILTAYVNSKQYVEPPMSKQLMEIYYKININCQILGFNNFLEDSVNLFKSSIALYNALDQGEFKLKDKNNDYKKLMAACWKSNASSLQNFLGVIYFKYEHIAEANACLKSAMVHVRKLEKMKDLPVGIGPFTKFYNNYYVHMAQISARNNDLLQAKKYISTGLYYIDRLEGIDKYNYMLEICRAYVEVGNLYLKRKQYKEAIEWLRSATELYAENRNRIKENMTKENTLSKIVINYDADSEKKKIDDHLAAIDRTIHIARIGIYSENYDRFMVLIREHNIPCLCEKDYGTFAVKLCFADDALTLRMKTALLEQKIVFAETDKGISINLEEIKFKNIVFAIDKYLIATMKTEPVTLSRESQASVPTVALKQEKAERHAMNVALKQQQPPTESDEKKEKATVEKKPSQIVWKDKRYASFNPKDPARPYHRIYSSAFLKTYFIFDQQELNSLPTKNMAKRFKAIAKKGRALGENSKGMQGIVFFKDDKALRKYGSEYVCKIKILGENGNHRFLGRRVTGGSKVVDGKTKHENCELIVFDKYISKGHK